MPQPILPLGRINSFDNIFPSNHNDNNDVSVASKYFQRESDNDDSIYLLELIDKHQDGIINAAVDIVHGKNAETYYSVPNRISDNQLLKLKTEGYVSGGGRSVRFTSKANEALKKKYLKTENTFRGERVKKKII